MEPFTVEYIKIFGNMLLNPVLSVSDIVTIVTLVSVIIGGIFALRKWTWSIRQKRAEYIDVITSRIRNNDEIRQTIYMFDYNSQWYTEKFHSSGQFEANVDKTLSYFSYICYLRDKNLIPKKDFEIFEYELNRIIRNHQTQDYLFNLYHFSKEKNYLSPFKPLIDYAEKENLLPKDFFDKEKGLNNNNKFHKYLNF